MHNAESLTLTVENPEEQNLSYTLQHSADLSPGSWIDQSATLLVLDPSRVTLTMPLEGALTGFVRVLAGPETLVSVVINEIMSNNESTAADTDGDFPRLDRILQHRHRVRRSEWPPCQRQGQQSRYNGPFLMARFLKLAITSFYSLLENPATRFPPGNCMPISNSAMATSPSF